MKKLLNLFGFISVIGYTGAATLTTINSQSNSISLPELQDNNFENNANLFSELNSEEIYEVSDIKDELFINNLSVNSEGNFKLNSEFLDNNHFSENVRIFLRKLIIDGEMYQNIIESQQAEQLDPAIPIDISTFSSRTRNLVAELPRRWFEWITLTWRINISDSWSRAIAGGATAASDMLGIFNGDISPTGVPWIDNLLTVSQVLEIISTIASREFSVRNQGNGVIVRFNFLLLPTDVSSSIIRW